jgi:hypothetical protein
MLIGLNNQQVAQVDQHSRKAKPFYLLMQPTLIDKQSELVTNRIFDFPYSIFGEAIY